MLPNAHLEDHREDNPFHCHFLFLLSFIVPETGQNTERTENLPHAHLPSLPQITADVTTRRTTQTSAMSSKPLWFRDFAITRTSRPRVVPHREGREARAQQAIRVRAVPHQFSVYLGLGLHVQFLDEDSALFLPLFVIFFFFAFFYFLDDWVFEVSVFIF